MNTLAVNVCDVLTAFTGDNGLIVMYASTHVFTALVLSWLNASPVARVKEAEPATLSVVEAFTVVCPGVEPLIVYVHVPKATPAVAVVQLPELGVTATPLVEKFTVSPFGSST